MSKSDHCFTCREYEFLSATDIPPPCSLFVHLTTSTPHSLVMENSFMVITDALSLRMASARPCGTFMHFLKSWGGTPALLCTAWTSATFTPVQGTYLTLCMTVLATWSEVHRSTGRSLDLGTISPKCMGPVPHFLRALCPESFCITRCPLRVPASGDGHLDSGPARSSQTPHPL